MLKGVIRDQKIVVPFSMGKEKVVGMYRREAGLLLEILQVGGSQRWRMVMGWVMREG